ncbi:MAG: DMT family transporter [Patescibacteria group bacterium]
MWVLLALIGAVADAAYYAFVKKSQENRTSPFGIASKIFLCAGIIIGIVSLCHGIPPIGHLFWLAIAAATIVATTTVALYFRALHTTDLSLTVPMLSFTPVIMLLTSYVLLHESVSWGGFAGIILIILGSYTLNINDQKNLLAPFRAMWHNAGVRAMLLVAVLFAVGAPLDKLIVRESDPFFGAAIIYFLLAVTCYAISRSINEPALDRSPRLWRSLLFGSLALSLVAISINLAYTYQIVPYVIAIKRLSIVFSVIIGGLFFREKNWRWRLAGAIILVAGAIIISTQ